MDAFDFLDSVAVAERLWDPFAISGAELSRLTFCVEKLEGFLNLSGTFTSWI